MTADGRPGATPIGSLTARERRDAFWAPFLKPDTVYENDDPADGHAHEFMAISPRSLGHFGPTGVACLKCGWFRGWGKPV